MLGFADGSDEGSPEGLPVGHADGWPVGELDSEELGTTLGMAEGCPEESVP